eukprot:2540229-Pyramimonas_sp.AAC.2
MFWALRYAVQLKCTTCTATSVQPGGYIHHQSSENRILDAWDGIFDDFSLHCQAAPAVVLEGVAGTAIP